jgi:hypothetical protein
MKLTLGRSSRLGPRGASPDVPRAIAFSTLIKLGKSWRSRPFVCNAARCITTAVGNGADHRKGRGPACRRINDGIPAGIVTLHGPVARRRKAEIVGLARHEEAPSEPNIRSIASSGSTRRKTGW